MLGSHQVARFSVMMVFFFDCYSFLSLSLSPSLPSIFVCFLLKRKDVYFESFLRPYSRNIPPSNPSSSSSSSFVHKLFRFVSNINKSTDSNNNNNDDDAIILFEKKRKSLSVSAKKKPFQNSISVD